MSFYNDLRNVASGLLAEFSQGTVRIGRPVTTTPSGGNEWDQPITAVKWTPINAVARGVSEKFVDGVNILSGDLQVTAESGVYTPRPGDRMQIDGSPAAILRIDRIPAAGTTVAYRIFVRSTNGEIADGELPDPWSGEFSEEFG